MATIHRGKQANQDLALGFFNYTIKSRLVNVPHTIFIGFWRTRILNFGNLHQVKGPQYLLTSSRKEYILIEYDN
jgi:hypothetical protein